MNGRTQHRSWILGIRGRAAGAALALAIMLVPAVLATGSAQAQTYTESVLYSFTGSPDGANPYAGLVRDTQGNLYGTTFGGGDLTCSWPGADCGTVFKVDASGNETVLYSFAGEPDGANPQASLALDAHGNVYGTTLYGGGSDVGTVFKLAPPAKAGDTWTETVLYSFCPQLSSCPDGGLPYAGLVRDAHGNLYGTTFVGGASGNGTVFKLAPPAKAGDTWTETVLYSFCSQLGCTDGYGPLAPLVRDAQGNLYGTTLYAGAFGCGTVFKVDTTGNETVVHSFAGPPSDGSFPYAGLVLDAQGNLYGTTSASGGLASGFGTVFKVDATGKETVLYSFSGGADGGDPVAGLVRDAQGNLYGTTNSGGASNYGTVFKLDTTGKESVLYSFCSQSSCTDGSYPYGGLVRDAQGNLYGTAGGGGASSYGTVFKLTPQTATATTLTPSPNPSTYGQPVIFTANVTSKLGAPPDGETVSFMKGKTVLGTGKLSGGTASFTDSTLPVGTNSITAVYAGDANFAGSKSKAVSQVVNKATTTTALTSSLNPSKVGQSVTFTASVTPEFSGTPTGTVTFSDNGTVEKTASLIGGAAKYTTKTLTKGTHTITATYNGSTSFTGSSASLTQTVN